MKEIIMDVITTTVGVAIAAKLFGKTGEKISDDIAKCYELGRDNIIKKALEKTKNIDDNAQVNLRIARDVFLNGSFSEEEVCAEYFGGVLASSRSEDGKDDSNMFLLNLIKILSSSELKLHYIIYNTLNKMIHTNNILLKNVYMDNDVNKCIMFFSQVEFFSLIESKGENQIGESFHILLANKLISSFQTDFHINKDTNQITPYICVSPSSLGIKLYSVAHNKNTSNFINELWSDFDNIKLPNLSGTKREEITAQLYPPD